MASHLGQQLSRATETYCCLTLVQLKPQLVDLPASNCMQTVALRAASKTAQMRTCICRKSLASLKRAARDDIPPCVWLADLLLPPLAVATACDEDDMGGEK